jgi:hypothetical protein
VADDIDEQRGIGQSSTPLFTSIYLVLGGSQSFEYHAMNLLSYSEIHCIGRCQEMRCLQLKVRVCQWSVLRRGPLKPSSVYHSKESLNRLDRTVAEAGGEESYHPMWLNWNVLRENEHTLRCESYSL